MKENDIKVKDGTDVNAIVRDMISVILEGTLDAEMDEESHQIQISISF